jgi:hypothetical protein
MAEGELLFYGGVGLMAAVAVAALVMGVLLCLAGKRLNQQLKDEFGRKRR